VIGRRATVRFEGELTLPPLQGICTELRSLAGDYDGARYGLVVEPRTAFLRLRRDHRIIRDAKAPALAKAIIAPLAERVGEVHCDDESDLPTHDYRVQYGETDWDALRRLLAEDGVSFVYDFDTSCDLRLVPDTTRLELARRTLPYLAGAGLGATDDRVVARVAVVAAARVESTRVSDEWVYRPDFDATASAALAREGATLEDYFFEPGVLDSEGELGRQARLRLLEVAVPATTLEVETNALVLPGTVLAIENAPVPAAERELLVVAVKSRWSAGREQAQTVHVLTCIDRRRRWVPPRLPKVRIAGIQRATIVGEGEIDVDALGRVLCCFRWDRGKLTSRRVEVSQAWAGAGYGHFAQPRVGDRVLVSYLDGDPDEPIVVGRVHDAKNVHPLSLPEQADTSTWCTKSTPGGEGYNEIGLCDTAGAELFWTHAQLDAEHVVGRDVRGAVGRDFTLDVARHTTMNLTGLTSVSAASPTTWKGVDLDIDADGHLAIKSNSRRDTVTADFDLSVGGNYNVVAGAGEYHTTPHLQVIASSQIFLTVGGSFLLLKPGSITLACGGSTLTMTPGKMTLVSPLIELNP
jgi:type VI secretion system secreted protein VgrG